MNKMKVVFCGTPEIAAGILQQLIAMDDVEILATISQPNKPVGRKKVLTPTAVKTVSDENQIRCFQPTKISEIYDDLKQLDFDFLITCAYGQFIPTKILNLAKVEPLNVHGSLLPQYRGGAPIQRAIINGDKTTGVSLMRMVKQMDAGDVFAELECVIEDKDTSGTLFKKIEILGQKIIKDNLLKIYNHEIEPIPQESKFVTFAPIITSEEENIDWTKSAIDIFNLTRGLLPTPVAHTFMNHERYKIGATRVMKENEYFVTTMMVHNPGEILSIDNEGIIIQTGNGFLKILELQRPGKKMQPANIYYNNHNLNDIKVGARFDTI
ncbi:Methionyl-tRNA formyltransferase [Mesoplasma lactucae ATCC 49193]|uniref:Methionyl-tRNA formyltransferase n=2 Tax=Mesoplasma lactucae TaxID=138853 RepID=A0A291IRF3_9MOLU|nr:methionyl-tRNA formyltransferase [Mesoplasma lactucae]ATG97340.1 methionyl-tRNA formyltransferase [Mesoplasma lactucae ATCC 49193]ATZ20208.1 methionyl-tRNA formyltransferase [Mesoplasma lactucae ATCC 49193]MCL8216957.1 Methionyl-tRNA formyltransferase [Mesoplasma lactucae ATCC 49193]